jgi:hypothetical protein
MLISPVMLMAGAAIRHRRQTRGKRGGEQASYQKTARIRESMIDRFTSPKYHGRNAMKKRWR